jgi:hypothetical protein
VGRKTVLVIVVLVFFASLLFAGGCGTKEEPAPAVEQTSETASAPTTSSAPSGGQTVHMNGRSVMYNWMKHWGCQGEGTVKKNGYTFDYKELDASELGNMSGSFASNTEGLPPGSIVFYKFCFADFSGDNLKALQDIVGKVVATAKERGFKLIVGNALPVRKQDGTPEMLKEYSAYNTWLEAKSKTDGFTVFDQYSVLAGSDGYLNPSYETEDSHPNGEAYDAMDAKFFPLLNSISSK